MCEGELIKEEFYLQILTKFASINCVSGKTLVT